MQADKLTRFNPICQFGADGAPEAFMFAVPNGRFVLADDAAAAIAEASEGLRADAMRWRALIGSARVRVLGSAGLRSELNPYGKPWNGYAHIGLELWTKHEAAPHEPTDAVEWVTKYADIAALSGAVTQGEG